MLRLLIVLGVLLTASELQAQTADVVLNPRLTVVVGGSFLKAQRPFQLHGNDFHSGFESSVTVGLRGGIDLNDTLGVEGGYTFSPNSLLMTQVGTQRRFDIRIHRIGVNALRYFITDGGLRLSVLAGIGMTRFIPTTDARLLAAEEGFVEVPTFIRASTVLNVDFGGSLEARIDRLLGLRVDLRDNISRVPRFGVPNTPSGTDTVVYPVRGAAHDIETSVGFVFYLE